MSGSAGFSPGGNPGAGTLLWSGPPMAMLTLDTRGQSGTLRLGRSSIASGVTLQVYDYSSPRLGVYSTVDTDDLMADRGVLHVRAWDPAAGRVDLEFEGVRLGESGYERACRVDGRLRSR
jgi:hypothetical protein